jgi:hypothetical protein
MIILSNNIQIESALEGGAWREFAANIPDGNIFHTPEMYRVFQAAARYHPTCWAAVDGAGCPLALFLPVEVAVLDGPLRLLSTRAIVYGGVLCEPSAAGRAALDVLLSEYKHHVPAPVVFTELRNQSDTADLQPVLIDHCFCYEDHLDYLIDLGQSPDDLWHNLHRTRKQNIRAAEREGVVIEPVTAPEQVAELYAVLVAIYHHINIPLPDESLFRAAFAELGPRGMINMLIARIDGHAAGALVNLLYKGRLITWYGGSDRTRGPNCANEMLNWHSICWARECGYTVYSFGGAGKPDEPYGPREYKARFGGRLVNFGRNVCVHAPRRLAISQTGYQWLRRVSHFPEAHEPARGTEGCKQQDEQKQQA